MQHVCVHSVQQDCQEAPVPGGNRSAGHGAEGRTAVLPGSSLQFEQGSEDAPSELSTEIAAQRGAEGASERLADGLAQLSSNGTAD